MRTFIYKAGIITTLAFGVLFFLLTFVNFHAVAYGVSVNGENIGGKSIDQAREMLVARAAHYQDIPITLYSNIHTWNTDPRRIGMLFHYSATAQKAYAIGRDGNILQNIAGFLHTAIFGVSMEFIIDVNQEIFDTYTNEYLTPFEQRARDATIVYDAVTEKFVIKEEKEGMLFNRSKLKDMLMHTSAILNRKNIMVVMEKDTPSLYADDIEKAKKRANEILKNAPITVVYRPPFDTVARTVKDSSRYIITKNQLKDMISFIPDGNILNVSIYEKEVKSWLMQIAPLINEHPQDAVLTFEDDKVKEFAISKKGIALLVDENISNIQNILYSDTVDKIVYLQVEEVMPDINTDTIENLGLIALLGIGESNFAGSPSSRAFNVRLGSEKINGVLIKPGEEFSFIKSIGDIDKKEGYQPALVIKGKNLVKEYGGGLCQVSTTMFRAALRSGVRITERFAHSLPVRYYDPQGFDAAIYGPHPDFRFVNDTPAHILVQTRVKDTKLFFEFYGTPDGREVKLIGPVEYDKKSDGSLKAKITREIYRDGQLAIESVFRSSYRSPWKYKKQKNPLE